MIPKNKNCISFCQHENSGSNNTNNREKKYVITKFHYPGRTVATVEYICTDDDDNADIETYV